MATRTNKQALYERYIKGCEYFGLAPEYEYKELTAKQWQVEVDALTARYSKAKRGEAIDTVKENTKQAVQYLEQNVGEPLDHFRKRASEMAKRAGRAIPVRISFGRK